MAQRQVSGAEKVGWSDAEGKNSAGGASLPPDLLSQVAAVERPGEEVQERLWAGPGDVKVRKLLSQEVNHLLKQQQSCLLLKQDAEKAASWALLYVPCLSLWELQTPALAHCFLFFPPLNQARRLRGQLGCVCPCHLPGLTPQARAWALASAPCSSAQHPSPVSLSVSLHRCPTRVLLQPYVAVLLRGDRKGGAHAVPSEAVMVVKELSLPFLLALRHSPQPPGFLLCYVCGFRGPSDHNRNCVENSNSEATYQDELTFLFSQLCHVRTQRTMMSRDRNILSNTICLIFYLFQTIK